MERRISFTGMQKLVYRLLPGLLAVVVLMAMVTTSLYGAGQPCSASKPKLKPGEALVNPLIFGNNLMWYRDDGFGIWDPEKKEPVAEVVNLARSAGITLMRWPGGCGLHHYKWKLGIGPQRTPIVKPIQFPWRERIENLFGLDEFMKVSKAVGAKAVIGISYFEDTPQSAAELVEYCNGSVETEWGKKRAENGHPEPYNIRLWEYGNETYHGDNGKTISFIDPAEYSKNFLLVSAAMKKVDPSIKIGVVTEGGIMERKWNQVIVRDAAPAADFLIVHTYPVYAYTDKPQHDPKRSFKATLAAALNEQDRYQEFLSATKNKLPLAITEYNTSFVYNDGLPAWRLSLGESLLCADLIAMMMRPENNVNMANYWQFVNEYWGQVSNEQHFVKGKLNDGPRFKKQIIKTPYWKRPAQYMFEMYKEHFGPIWFPVQVSCPSYKSPPILGVKPRKVPVLSVNASFSADRRKIFLMIINKDLDSAHRVWIKGLEGKGQESPAGVDSVIQLDMPLSAKKATAWVLTGPAIEADNEVDPNTVKTVVDVAPQVLASGGIVHILQPRSLTALEIELK